MQAVFCLFFVSYRLESFHYLPIDDTPRVFDVIGAAILVVEVVKFHTSKPRSGFNPAYRVASVSFFRDMELSILVCRQPSPSWTEQTDSSGTDSFLKFSKLPKSRLIASPNFPPGSFLKGFGANWRKYRVWFNTWPALLKIAPSGADTTISSKLCFRIRCPEWGCWDC